MSPITEYLWSFLYSQFFETPPYPQTSFTDQTIIVTGASSGLGLEAACHFARLGAGHIILAVRDEAKGAAAADQIRKQESTSTKCKIDVWTLDLSSFASIKSFARRVRTKLGRLDVLVQNAGVSDDQYSLTGDEHEVLLQTHVLGPALLALLLVPYMKLSSKQTRLRGRMTFCGSGIYTLARLKELYGDDETDVIEALDDPRKADMPYRYMTTKLLMLYLAQGLADALPLSDRTSPVINYTSPGFARSNIVRKELGFMQSIIKEAFTVCLARRTEVGARVLVDATRSEDSVLPTHGHVLRDCKIVKDPGDHVTSDAGKAMTQRFLTSLWAQLERVEPGVTSVIRGSRDLTRTEQGVLSMSWVEVS